MMGSSIINQPKVSVNLLGDTTAVQNTAHRVLIVGQQLAAGTATSGELQEQIANDSSENTLFGEGSHLAMMIRAFKLNNKVTRVDAIGLADAGAGVQATGAITIAGTTATAAGVYVVSIGSSRNHQYSIAVPATSTPTDVATLIETAINADLKCPLTAVATLGVVALTARHKGVVGNGISIKISGSIPALTTAVTLMASGATNPTLTTLFDVVATERYQTVIYPGAWGTTAITDFLDNRFNTTGQVLDGVGIMTTTDTYANHLVANAAENSESLVMINNKIVADSTYTGSAILEMDDSISAQVGALRALRLTDGTSIAHIVSAATGPRDSFGGVHLASKPYFNTPLQYLPLTSTGKGFGDSEIEALLASGGTVIGNNIPGTDVVLGEVVTTYKTDSGGNTDTSFKLLNQVDTGVNAREYFHNNVRAQYTQSRLTDGDLIPGVASANSDSIKAYLVGLYSDMTGPDYALTRSGEDNLNIFKDNMSVDLTLSTGKVTADMVVPIVTQFREFAGTVRIRF